MRNLLEKIEKGNCYTETEAKKISKLIHEYQFDDKDAVLFVRNSSTAVANIL